MTAVLLLYRQLSAPQIFPESVKETTSVMSQFYLLFKVKYLTDVIFFISLYESTFITLFNIILSF